LPRGSEPRTPRPPAVPLPRGSEPRTPRAMAGLSASWLRATSSATADAHAAFRLRARTTRPPPDRRPCGSEPRTTRPPHRRRRESTPRLFRLAAATTADAVARGPRATQPPSGPLPCGSEPRGRVAGRTGHGDPSAPPCRAHACSWLRATRQVATPVRGVPSFLPGPGRAYVFGWLGPTRRVAATVAGCAEGR